MPPLVPRRPGLDVGVALRSIRRPDHGGRECIVTGTAGGAPPRTAVAAGSASPAAAAITGSGASGREVRRRRDIVRERHANRAGEGG